MNISYVKVAKWPPWFSVLFVLVSVFELFSPSTLTCLDEFMLGKGS